MEVSWISWIAFKHFFVFLTTLGIVAGEIKSIMCGMDVYVGHDIQDIGILAHFRINHLVAATIAKEFVPRTGEDGKYTVGVFFMCV